MFKKFMAVFASLLIFNISSAKVFADELSDVKIFFVYYVKAANSYSKSVTDYYLPDAKIIRVVIKPDGTEQPVDFPMARYNSELRKGLPLARLSRYKNTYTDVNYEKLSDGDYKITAMRKPNQDKKPLPFYFIATNTKDGWKVKEESMHTTVQKFLKSK